MNADEETKIKVLEAVKMLTTTAGVWDIAILNDFRVKVAISGGLDENDLNVFNQIMALGFGVTVQCEDDGMNAYFHLPKKQ